MQDKNKKLLCEYLSTHAHYVIQSTNQNIKVLCNKRVEVNYT